MKCRWLSLRSSRCARCLRSIPGRVRRSKVTVVRELAPAGVRSAPAFFGAATQPSGSKLPRHR
ncbi:hypothetical protein CEC48_24680 [Pseudomonas sp. K2I15]|nr:hypothetical protein CEC48_24680 [Pseudomonas sp. K2I15]